MTLKHKQGSITAPLLIIAGSFILVIYGLVFMLTSQLDSSFRQTAYDEALYIAEAGVQYYRWHLAHSPNDYTDGTGAEGPYVHEYQDAQGDVIGSFSLEIENDATQPSIVTIQSTGWTTEYPEAKRTITVRYGIPSLAQYSFLSNAVSWYGEGITVYGPIHSNTGIRMDGINMSTVSSYQEEYQCNFETGCSPTQNKPGVWGAGPNYDLWIYPSHLVDFDEALFDLASMKDYAISVGHYLPETNEDGYHIVFNSNGTYTVSEVTRTQSYHGYTSFEGCRRLNQEIQTEDTLGTYDLTNVPIIFAEATVWVEGTVNGKVTVAAAEFPLQSVSADIIINDNIVYLDKSGDHVLGLVAHNDLIFNRDISNNFEVDGALMAQDGKIIRHGYDICRSDSNAIKNSLTIYGAILSDQKSYWNYGNPLISGFITRTINFDANLTYGPPPFFPDDGDYEFISWEEN